MPYAGFCVKSADSTLFTLERPIEEDTRILAAKCLEKTESPPNRGARDHRVRR